MFIYGCFFIFGGSPLLIGAFRDLLKILNSSVVKLISHGCAACVSCILLVKVFVCKLVSSFSLSPISVSSTLMLAQSICVYLLNFKGLLAYEISSNSFKINICFELKLSFNVKRVIPDLLGPFIFLFDCIVLAHYKLHL